MIGRVIEWFMSHGLVVECLAILFVALGIRAVLTARVDAIPDLSENQVIVFADGTERGPRWENSDAPIPRRPR